MHTLNVNNQPTLYYWGPLIRLRRNLALLLLLLLLLLLPTHIIVMALSQNFMLQDHFTVSNFNMICVNVDWFN